jgi:Tfp pilus assembly protein PilN
MPENVRLLSLRPFLDEQEKIGLTMDVRGRTLGDATEFLRTLEQSDIFTDVSLAVQERKTTNGEVEFSLDLLLILSPDQSCGGQASARRPPASAQPKALPRKVSQ